MNRNNILLIIIGVVGLGLSFFFIASFAGLIFSFVYSVIGAVVILYLSLSGKNMIAAWIMLGISLIITVGSSVAAIVIGSRNSGRK